MKQQKNRKFSKSFNFELFQIKMQMLSHDKISFHMVFGAFHITYRINVLFTGHNMTHILPI